MDRVVKRVDGAACRVLLAAGVVMVRARLRFNVPGAAMLSPSALSNSISSGGEGHGESDPKDVKGDEPPKMSGKSKTSAAIWFRVDWHSSQKTSSDSEHASLHTSSVNEQWKRYSPSSITPFTQTGDTPRESAWCGGQRDFLGS